MAKKRMKKLVDPYIIRDGRDFRLKDFDPGDTGGIKTDKPAAEGLLQDGVARLRDLQEKLYAQDRWGLLLVFQAMDAAGKDGAIKHVMSGINPQGCQVYSFKQPSTQELDHDFLWRNMVCLPERGRIGIFNRSYYEEVLVVRVHPELLEKQQIPSELVTRRIWKERFDDINGFERYLSRNGYVIRKFFLHLSKKEQAKRFEKRLDDPDKQWKFSLGDLREREKWKDYAAAYEDAIRHTSTHHAPWVIVPANKKWFARWVVAATVIDALEGLDLAFPKVTPAKRLELQKGRRILQAARRNDNK
ncbi:MAG TPA: polyphosphate kinase 2 family protein [Vicinamibacterales bacterium]|jgi:PPK2 family polyphosphate:nucleotide phosphotransferase